MPLRVFLVLFPLLLAGVVSHARAADTTYMGHPVYGYSGYSRGGALYINAFPSFAEVSLDGKPIGVANDLQASLVDARVGVTAQDKEIANKLRKAGRPVFVAVNKAEGMNHGIVAADFHELGLGEPHSISATHGEGVRGLLELALDDFPEPVEGEEDGKDLKVAIVGRPNVGKSTMINALLGEERVIAFDQPGTTRDAIYVDFERAGRKYTLIDTAGLRRKGKVFETIEKFSVIKTLQSIEDANVVVLVLDAKQDISDQDAHIAGFVVESGRALVVAINKWDGLDSYAREQVKEELERRLKFLDFARFQIGRAHV